MKPRHPDPRRNDPRNLDVAAVAASAACLSGRWPLAGFARLVEGTPAGTSTGGDVQWSVRGQQRLVPGSDAQIWLHLAAQVRVWRECQRCLQPMPLDLEVSRPLRFVAGEEVAAALDAESEDDVLALNLGLDLHELVEDELLLALPLVPTHDQCPQPLPGAADDGALEPAAHPFAALAGLKRRGQ
jgi:uncharacterized protein